MFCHSNVTGKSFSEALILALVNPHYDRRLFIEFPEKYKNSRMRASEKDLPVYQDEKRKTDKETEK